MGRARTLSEDAVREIVRLRLNGVAGKEIAQRFGCTERQVEYYWGKSPAYDKAMMLRRKRLAAARLRREAKGAAVIARRKKAQEREFTLAQAALRMIIEDARAHPATVPYKPGLLEW